MHHFFKTLRIKALQVFALHAQNNYNEKAFSDAVLPPHV